jgi:hypothetical protein
MQIRRLGGSIEIDETAVAVIPIGSRPTQIEITFTVEATRRIAWRKSSVSRMSPSSIAPKPWRGAAGVAMSGVSGHR